MGPMPGLLPKNMLFQGFAGLKGADINQRIFAFVTSRIVKPLCREIRHEFRLPDSRTRRISRTELELIWGLNSRIFYFGVRKYIYGMPLPDNLDELIEIEINTFFEGVGSGHATGVWHETPQDRPEYREQYQRKLARQAKARKSEEMI